MIRVVILNPNKYMNMNMNNDMNMLRETEHYLRKTSTTKSKPRTKLKMIKFSVVGLRTRRYLSEMVPLSDRKNPEFD